MNNPHQFRTPAGTARASAHGVTRAPEARLFFPRPRRRILLRALIGLALLTPLLAGAAPSASSATPPVKVSLASLLFFQEGAEAVATYAVDASGGCTATPKTAFVLNDAVCVKVANAPSIFDFPCAASNSLTRPATFTRAKP